MAVSKNNLRQANLRKLNREKEALKRLREAQAAAGVPAVESDEKRAADLTLQAGLLDGNQTSDEAADQAIENPDEDLGDTFENAKIGAIRCGATEDAQREKYKYSHKRPEATDKTRKDRDARENVKKIQRPDNWPKLMHWPPKKLLDSARRSPFAQAEIDAANSYFSRVADVMNQHARDYVVPEMEKQERLAFDLPRNPNEYNAKDAYYERSAEDRAEDIKWMSLLEMGVSGPNPVHDHVRRWTRDTMEMHDGSLLKAKGDFLEVKRFGDANQAIIAMVAEAKARGWPTIEARGNKKFCEAIIKAAHDANMAVEVTLPGRYFGLKKPKTYFVMPNMPYDPDLVEFLKEEAKAAGMAVKDAVPAGPESEISAKRHEANRQAAERKGLTSQTGVVRDEPQADEHQGAGDEPAPEQQPLVTPPQASKDEQTRDQQVPADESKPVSQVSRPRGKPAGLKPKESANSAGKSDAQIVAEANAAGIDDEAAKIAEKARKDREAREANDVSTQRGGKNYEGRKIKDPGQEPPPKSNEELEIEAQRKAQEEAYMDAMGHSHPDEGHHGAEYDGLR